eukprot:366245-Chlamydomonas_euryale.AAC.4
MTFCLVVCLYPCTSRPHVQEGGEGAGSPPDALSSLQAEVAAMRARLQQSEARQLAATDTAAALQVHVHVHRTPPTDAHGVDVPADPHLAPLLVQRDVLRILTWDRCSCFQVQSSRNFLCGPVIVLFSDFAVQTWALHAWSFPQHSCPTLGHEDTASMAGWQANAMRRFFRRV